jgi:hypothetical protein
LANLDVYAAFAERMGLFADPNETANKYRLFMFGATLS